MDLTDQHGECCVRVREGTDQSGQPIYAYDFNDDGQGGTEDHPYFTVSSSDPSLFSAGEVYPRELLEEVFGIAGGIPVVFGTAQATLPPSPSTEELASTDKPEHSEELASTDESESDPPAPPRTKRAR